MQSVTEIALQGRAEMKQKKVFVTKDLKSCKE